MRTSGNRFRRPDGWTRHSFSLGSGRIGRALGTAFLACPESGASDVSQTRDPKRANETRPSSRAPSPAGPRAVSRNDFIARLEGQENAILPYPLQNALTRTMRTAAAQAGSRRIPVALGRERVWLARAMPAGDLVRCLVEEMDQGRRAGSATHSG